MKLEHMEYKTDKELQDGFFFKLIQSVFRAVFNYNGLPEMSEQRFCYVM